MLGKFNQKEYLVMIDIQNTSWIQNGFEYKGEWWLPEQPKLKVAGTLKTEERSKIVLDIHGSLNIEKNCEKIILGKYGFEEITLLKVFLYKESYESYGLSQQFLVECVIVGTHFSLMQKVMFDRWSVSYTYLEDWLATNVFSVREGKRHSSVSSSFPNYKDIYISSLNLTLRIQSSFYSEDVLHKSIRREHRACIEIIPAEPKGLDWFNEISFYIQVFLSLCLGIPSYRKAVEYSIGSQKLKYLGKSIVLPNFENPIYHLRDLLEYNSAIKIEAYEIILKYPVIKRNLQKYLDRWFEGFNKLNLIYNLFFSIIEDDAAGQTRYPHDFLIISQALEAYYKVVYPHRSQRINYRKALEFLLKEVDRTFYAFLSDKDTFVDDIVQTRNYYTHYSETLKDKALSGIRLHRLAWEMRIFFRLLLFKNIGVSKSKPCIKRFQTNFWRRM